MLKSVKVRSGRTCDGYGRALSFDMETLRSQWAKADKHKAKRTGNLGAVGEIAHAHSPLAVKPA